MEKKIHCIERFYFLITGNGDFRRKKKALSILEKREETKRFATNEIGNFFLIKSYEMLRVTKKEHQIEDVKLTH